MSESCCGHVCNKRITPPKCCNGPLTSQAICSVPERVVTRIGSRAAQLGGALGHVTPRTYGAVMHQRGDFRKPTAILKGQSSAWTRQTTTHRSHEPQQFLCSTASRRSRGSIDVNLIRQSPNSANPTRFGEARGTEPMSYLLRTTRMPEKDDGSLKRTTKGRYGRLLAGAEEKGGCQTHHGISW